MRRIDDDRSGYLAMLELHLEATRRRELRTELTGTIRGRQRARLESLLLRGIKSGRPPVWTRRQLIEGMRWRTRTGAPWRDVPERYGPWDRVSAACIGPAWSAPAPMGRH
jgi:transposase